MNTHPTFWGPSLTWMGTLWMSKHQSYFPSLSLTWSSSRRRTEYVVFVQPVVVYAEYSWGSVKTTREGRNVAHCWIFNTCLKNPPLKFTPSLPFPLGDGVDGITILFFSRRWGFFRLGHRGEWKVSCEPLICKSPQVCKCVSKKQETAREMLMRTPQHRWR